MGSAEMGLFSEQVKARAQWRTKAPSLGLDDAGVDDDGGNLSGDARDQGCERPVVALDHPLLDLVR